jgi:hypothetical protein
VAPDWAFDLGSNVTDWKPIDERRHIGLVLRGDRHPPSDEWFQWFGELAEGLALIPIVVVQVSRDSESGASFARRLNATIQPWLDTRHDHQEQAVRAIYADCAVVVGDRHR